MLKLDTSKGLLLAILTCTTGNLWPMIRLLANNFFTCNGELLLWERYNCVSVPASPPRSSALQVSLPPPLFASLPSPLPCCCPPICLSPHLHPPAFRLPLSPPLLPESREPLPLIPQNALYLTGAYRHTRLSMSRSSYPFQKPGISHNRHRSNITPVFTQTL